MSTCGDEVLPYPPDVVIGLKAFRIGLCVAFGLASLFHVIISNIWRDSISGKNTCVREGSVSIESCFMLLVHLVPVSFIILQEVYSGHWNSLPEERVQLMEDNATLMVFAFIILARSISTRATTAIFLLGMSLSSCSLLSSGRVSMVFISCTFFCYLLLCVAMLRRTTESAAQLWAEQRNGITVLRGVFLLFTAALLALQTLQRQGVLEAPICTLCSALLAGCVRHVFVVVCNDSHYGHLDNNVTAEYSVLEQAVEELEDETHEIRSEHSVTGVEENDEFQSTLQVDTAVTTKEYDESHSSVAWSPSPTQTNVLEDKLESEEYHPRPGLDAFGSADFYRSNSTGLSEQPRQHTADHDNASRRQLLRYVFHEMRAPLNSISMAVDLLTHHSKKGTPKNKFQDLETLQIIEEATLMMERTLKDTMTLQKIEEGSLVAQLKIFSLLNLCDDIKDALKPVLKSNSVTLNYVIDPIVPDQIVGDHFRIRHVVAHVLSNAIKFSRAGGVVEMHVNVVDHNPSVAVGNRSRTCSSGLAGADIGEDSGSSDMHDLERRVSANTAKEYDLCPSERGSFDNLDDPSFAKNNLKSPTENTADRKYVMISITDNGIGMSSELQESDIFKPFNQLKTEEITGFRGTGLGLAICKKIINFLHGSITYSSVEGVGTTFRISFPLTLLDSASMDEVDEDDLPAIELSCGSVDPGDFLTSPRTQRRNRAIAKAKSFRGEKLLSILHNQSNVFDCPTPGSCTAGNHFHSRFSSTDESDGRHTRDSSGGSGPLSKTLSVNVSASVSASASNEHTPRSSASLGKGIEVSRVPSIAEDLDRGESVGRYRGGSHTPPRGPFVAPIGNRNSPTRPVAASTLHNLKLPLDGIPIHSLGELGDNVTPESDTLITDSTVQTMQNSLSHTNPFERPNIQVDISASIPPTSPIGGVSNSQEYVALTEKNVNLHILRTAATDGGIRAVKRSSSRMRKACSKEALLATLKACKILVVDDAASNRKLLSMMLKRAGFVTVDLVEDGQAAVDYCNTARSEGDLPKMIFMDNTMPRMTGIEASRIIRQGGFPHLIIGVTGNSMEEELDDFIAAGADLVIVKPLKNQSLEMLLGFVQSNGFDSSHGYRIETVDQEFTWVPRNKGSGEH